MFYNSVHFRRKRHYANQDLQSLLLKEGIETCMLMPRAPAEDEDTVVLNKDSKDPAPFPAYLPLHIFDNEEYSKRKPEEWLLLGQENGVRKPVPGRALLPSRDDMHHREYRSKGFSSSRVKS